MKYKKLTQPLAPGCINPGYASRFFSMDHAAGGRSAFLSPARAPKDKFKADNSDLVKKLNSGQVWQLLPSSKGKR